MNLCKFSDIIDVDLEYLPNWCIYKIERTRDFNIYEFENIIFDNNIDVAILYNESHGQHIIFVNNDIYNQMVVTNTSFGPYDNSYFVPYIYKIDEGSYWTDHSSEEYKISKSHCMIINNKDIVKWVLFSIYEFIETLG